VKIKDKLKINGIPISLQNPDLDGDGIVGGTEVLTKSRDDVMPITESTELKDALLMLNKDEINNRLSSMDFVSRLDKYEIPPMVIFDVLISVHCVPIRWSILNRSKQRKSVSEGGKGREEIVTTTTGKQEREKAASFAQGSKNFIGMGDKN